MKVVNNIFSSITANTVHNAVDSASEGHMQDVEVKKFLSKKDANVEEMYCALMDGTWMRFIKYRQLVKVNPNRKVRHIDQPSLRTRIYQHLMLLLLQPLYEKKDPMVARNCKKRCGITSTVRCKSVLREMKHLLYDKRKLCYGVYVDERKSYEHCHKAQFIRGLRCLTTDQKMIDFCVGVTFIGDNLPIGTPASPFAHHVIHLRFDIWLKTIAPFTIRYADDIFCACVTKRDAHQTLWRIKQYLWYELHMIAKHTARVFPLSVQFDFCGFLMKRNDKALNEHDKGYVVARQNIRNRAKRAHTDESWGSYFGLLKHADSWRLMTKIESTMKLRNLTEKIRIDRSLDAPNIDIKEIVCKTFDIQDYAYKRDKSGAVNWVKCLVSIKDEEGRLAAREFHGNFPGIYTYLLECEKNYKKEEMLPIEECVLVNQCGYIFEDSTNQIKYFDE